MDATWEKLDLTSVPTAEGIGGLAAMFDEFLESTEAVQNHWSSFNSELSAFSKRLQEHGDDVPSWERFEIIVDDRHFASSGLRLFRTSVQICRYYRKKALRDSPKLAFLLGEIESWMEAQELNLERMVWSQTSSVTEMSTDNSEELGLLLARIANTNRVLANITNPEVVEFRDQNERFVQALSHYVTEARSSTLELESDSIVDIARVLEPRLNSLRDHAYELSKSYETISVVHVLLLEVERHMIDSMVLFKRLRWLRPRTEQTTKDRPR